MTESLQTSSGIDDFYPGDRVRLTIDDPYVAPRGALGTVQPDIYNEEAPWTYVLFDNIIGVHRMAPRELERAG